MTDPANKYNPQYQFDLAGRIFDPSRPRESVYMQYYCQSMTLFGRIDFVIDNEEDVEVKIALPDSSILTCSADLINDTYVEFVCQNVPKESCSKINVWVEVNADGKVTNHPLPTDSRAAMGKIKFKCPRYSRPAYYQPNQYYPARDTYQQQQYPNYPARDTYQNRAH